MNLSQLWCTTDLLSKLCEVTTWLDEDPHYEKADAVKDLLEIIEFVNNTFYSQAIHAKNE